MGWEMGGRRQEAVSQSRRDAMFIVIATERDEAPEGRNVDIALLTELESSSVIVAINIALLTELLLPASCLLFPASCFLFTCL